MENDDKRGIKLVVAPRNFKPFTSKTGKNWVNVGLVVVAPSDRKGQWVNYSRCLLEGREDYVRTDFQRMGIEGDPYTMTPETFQPPAGLCVVIEKFDEYFKEKRITNILGAPSEAYMRYLEKNGEDLTTTRKPDAF